jgi:unsaturated rhamnogalacturonyl hydrolase
MKNLLFISIALACFMSTRAQDNSNDEAILRKVADYILEHSELAFEGIYNKETYTEAKNIPDTVKVKFKNQFAVWAYPNGVLNMAMINLGNYLKEEKYSDYAVKHIAFAFSNYKIFEERNRNTPNSRYPLRQITIMKELDDCGALGASVIEISNKKNTTEYRDYIDRAAKHIFEVQDRLPDGTFVRKGPNEMTLWADDLYMSVPFLARMGKLTSEVKYFNDAVKQVLNFDKYLWDATRELYYHCYFTDWQRNGVAHWGRCNGWVMMAQAHLLSFLPDDHPQRKAIIANLEKQIVGIAKYQSPEGLWHQVLDRTDSYLESSCSAMFVYSIAKAINAGWINKQYASIAITGWEGLKAQKITPEGQMKDVCIGTGIRNDMVFYYQRPAVLNEIHGLGALIEAGIEVMKLKQSMPLNTKF